MIQAAVSSAIDFTAADPRSRTWWLKVRWILDRIEDLNVEKVYQMQHAQNTSVLDYSLQQETFNGHWKASNQLLHEVYGLNFPWAKGKDGDKKQTEINNLMEQWKAKYGDPADPAVLAKYKKIADAWRKSGQESTQHMFQEQNQLRGMLNKVVKSRRAGKKK
jgi:hypothetical protein